MWGFLNAKLQPDTRIQLMILIIRLCRIIYEDLLIYEDLCQEGVANAHVHLEEASGQNCCNI